MARLTEPELIDRYRYFTMEVESLLLAGEDFRSVADTIPIAVHINHPQSLEVLQTNAAHAGFTGHCLDEINEMGEKFLEVYIHPRSLDYVAKHLPPFYAEAEKQQSLAFVQYLYFDRGRRYRPIVTFTKPSLLPSGAVVCLSPFPHQFGGMARQIEQVVEMDRFRLRNFRKFQQLTAREIQLLKQLAQGLGNGAIADLFGISRQTVETHRKHLKRKLELSSFQELLKFALTFDLLDFH